MSESLKNRLKSLSNRNWQSFSSSLPSNCDVVVTFGSSTTQEQIQWISNRLRARIPEIIFTKTFHKATQRQALYLTCAFKDLLKGAEAIRLRKRLKDDCGVGLQEFCIEDVENFKGVEDEDTFFTSSERQNIVKYYLMSLRAMGGDAWDEKNRFSHGQAIIPVLLAAGKIATIFPLHDHYSLSLLLHQWVHGFTHRQPLDLVAEYFGIEIALYFAWLGHYTTALIFPAVFGLLCWRFLPAGKAAALYHPVLAFCTMLWAVFFQESWKRRSSYYTHHWGTLDKTSSLLEEPRPLFRGALEPSPITGRLEPFYPRWRRNLIVCLVSFPVVLLCLIVVVVVAVGHIKLQELTEQKASQWSFPGAKFLPFLPLILHALDIAILDAIYRRIAIYLTNLENHRLRESYNLALAAKLILFQFINAFYASFYIAFCQMDLDLLRQHLIAILVTRQIAGNLKEVFVPLGQTRLRQVYLSLRADGFASLKREDDPPLPKCQDSSPVSTAAQSSDVESVDSAAPAIPISTSPTQFTRIEKEEIMPQYDNATDDFLEMFIQFGFVSMFNCAFPICGLLAFLNNILEIRSDAFKLVTNFQRPFAQIATGIGVWERAFEILSYVAITVNIGLIGVSGSLEALLPGHTPLEYTLILIGVEHTLFALRFGLSHIVPPIPLSLETSIAVLEHRRREALLTIEREVRKEAKRTIEVIDTRCRPEENRNSDIDSS